MTTTLKAPAPGRSAPNLIDITGKTFGRLKVLGKAASRVHGRAKVAYWLCRCRCGTVLEVRGDKMREGQARSCGCSASDTQKAVAAKPNPKPSPTHAMPAPTPPPPQTPPENAANAVRAARTPRVISAEDRARMVNAFLVSGFTRRESEEMAAMGTVVAAKKPA